MNSLKVKWSIILLLSGVSLCHAQSFYVKTGGAFNFAISKQPLPKYFAFRVPNLYGATSQVYLGNQDFSIAQGVNFQGTVGYALNDFLSLELGVSYFANTKHDFGASPVSKTNASGSTNWNYKNYSLLPGITIGKVFGRSKISINIFGGVGFSDLDVTAHFDSYLNVYSFTKSVSYSYGYNIEYAYKIAQKLQWYVNAGLLNTYYTPRHADMVSSSFSLNLYNRNEKEINYVKRIDNLKTDYAGQQYIDQPGVDTRKTLILNSVSIGTGIKYTFIK